MADGGSYTQREGGVSGNRADGGNLEIANINPSPPAQDDKIHAVLHGFREGRGTGTATLKAKLLQQLAAMKEEVLYVIFLDLTKAYDALDKSRTLEILKGYGVGERVRRLLTVYWERTTMVARAGSYYGKGFKGERGVTQGNPLSPTIFNMVVDAVVRHWLQLATQEA